MSETRDGGPAFPHPNPEYSPNHNLHVVNRAFGGMSLRDWFAGQALAGTLSNGDTPWSPDVADIEDSEVAKACFDLADAMLAARTHTS